MKCFTKFVSCRGWVKVFLSIGLLSCASVVRIPKNLTQQPLPKGLSKMETRNQLQEIFHHSYDESSQPLIKDLLLEVGDFLGECDPDIHPKYYRAPSGRYIDQVIFKSLLRNCHKNDFWLIKEEMIIPLLVALEEDPSALLKERFLKIVLQDDISHLSVLSFNLTKEQCNNLVDKCALYGHEGAVKAGRLIRLAIANYSMNRLIHIRNYSLPSLGRIQMKRCTKKSLAFLNDEMTYFGDAKVNGFVNAPRNRCCYYCCCLGLPGCVGFLSVVSVLVYLIELCRFYYISQFSSYEWLDGE